MLKTVYRFRNYELDPKYRELRRDGQLVALPLKSFDCLVYLVEHDDRVVGRDELIAAVWGKADINDHTLAQTLSRVRQALRDANGDADNIRTVPRFGYRWVMPTRRVQVDVAEDAVALETPIPPASVDPAVVPAQPASLVAQERPRRQHGLLALAGFVVAIASGVVYVVHIRTAEPSPPVAQTIPATSGDSTYLVMPVLVDADASDVAWMRLGVMDYIGVALKEGGERRVLPNDQILSLTAGTKQGGQLESAELGRLMALTGATHVVQAHARKTDAGWRFALDLFHGDTLRSYSGTAPAPLEAVRAALNPMMRDLNLVGHLAPPSSHDETLQRIDAALLIGDLAQVQQLLDTNATQVAENSEFRLRVGQLALRRGRLDEARQSFRTLIDENPADISSGLRAQALLGLAGAELQRPDFDAADKGFTEAIALLRDGGDEQVLGNAYAGRGASYTNRNRFEDAMVDFGRARVALDRAGDRIGIARLEINIAAADAYRGRLAQAVEAQDRSIKVLTAFGVRDQLLVVLHNKIYVQLGMLDLEGARETSRLAFEQAQQFDNERMKRRIAAARTRVLLICGQLAEAGRLIDRFDAVAPAAVEPEFVSLRLELLLQQGNPARAADLAMDSLERIAGSEGFASQPLFAWTAYSGVDAALRSGRIELAERLIDRLAREPISARDDDRPMILDLARAELLQARGSRAGARPLFSAALAAAEKGGDVGTIIAVASTWLRHLLGEHDLEAAAPVAGRLTAYAERDYGVARVLQAYYRASGQLTQADQIEARIRALAGERDPGLPL